MLQISAITDELLSSFGFYAVILALEFVAISYLTGQERLKTKTFLNSEDAERHEGSQFIKTNPGVERLRRICRNDMENIPMFLVVAAFYTATGPNPFYYLWLLRLYVASRIAYTIAYKTAARAPIRSVIYSVGLYFIHLPMLLSVLYSSCW